MNWKQARRFCAKRKARMVVIESETERLEIAQLLKGLLKRKWRFWVGVKKRNGVWKTNSGEPLSYTPWSNKGGWSGDCVRVGEDMMWYEAECWTSGAQWGYTYNPFCKKAF